MKDCTNTGIRRKNSWEQGQKCSTLKFLNHKHTVCPDYFKLSIGSILSPLSSPFPGLPSLLCNTVIYCW